MTRRLAKGQADRRADDNRATIKINPFSKRPLTDSLKQKLTEKLVQAAMDGDEREALKLLSEGADINGHGLDWPPLVMATLSRQTEMILFLGMEGADIEVKDKQEGRTALLWAAANGFYECVVALINMEAFQQAKDSLGNTSHRLAVQNRHYQVAEFLEEK